MSLITTDRAGNIARVTLADPERRNALSVEMMTELVAAVDELETDPGIRAVVLTNQGTTFCAGGDVASRAREGQAIGNRAPSAVALFQRFAASSKPYIGRLNGHCMGGGMGLAAAMDISITVEEARFGFPEVRLGVAPAIVSVLCLPKMRLSDARDAFIRGRKFSAAEAVSMGLVNRVVPADLLDSAIDEVIADILAASPAAIAATKRVLAEVPKMSAPDAVAWTAELSAELFRGDEAQAGIAAFRGRKPAPWHESWPATADAGSR
ncbi:enoyl-CoA hydratase/isomerase family protein [Micromonospora inositola]|uniref:Methylglutaconyl-CoA hydratase n=1 Tax=Micromonospora inositola TaxID=47865 RepID=A0A1C5JNG7_9ACTN|nr:enoyl-CoA hydratase/isomerase family protein [Micromonospora inositola]SCG72023.1 methylglutaconyl-CoA hydratase [Micromonospora inositola]